MPDNKEKALEAIARKLMIRDGLNADVYFNNRDSKHPEIQYKILDYINAAERILNLPELKAYFKALFEQEE